MNTKICKSCQSPADKGARFCTDCGAPLINSCSCGYQLSGSESYCPQCGSKTIIPAERNVRKPSGSEDELPNLSIERADSQKKFITHRVPEFTAGEELLGQYRVIEKIGSGGKGVVYRVLHLALNEEMAIKAVGSFDSIDSLLEEYRDEYKAQVGIRNEHILHVEAPVKLTKNNINYLLLPMELARESFADWLRRHPVGDEKRLEQGLEQFRQACLGVQAIHKKGLVHLDLKPENLLLIGDEQAPTLKVADFGLTRSMMSRAQRGGLFGDGIGTPAYMAPEQILAARWKDVGKEADIYALGMILYELLDGDLPYSGSAEQIKAKKQNSNIAITPPQGSKPLGQLALKCLDHNKTMRPIRIDTFLENMDSYTSYSLVNEFSWDEVTIHDRNFIESTSDLDLEMIYVRGGLFLMGNKAGLENERPTHKVEIDDYHLGKYQITQKQWKIVMGMNPSRFIGDNYPVENVSWEDAQDFVRKLISLSGKTYRLPTEAEWEYAACGGQMSRGCVYAGSDILMDVGWFDSNSDGKIQQVGCKKPNEIGLHDMSGNAWEWCSDWYDSVYYKISPRRNPQGPASGTSRIYRGGSWLSSSVNCRCSDRRCNNQNYRSSSIGFRLACSA